VWELGSRPELAGLRLRVWAHMLGFRGHWSWSNEGLFAFSEGLRRLAELDTTQRVAAPFIDVEA
jgi:hypothetical protein